MLLLVVLTLGPEGRRLALACSIELYIYIYISSCTLNGDKQIEMAKREKTIQREGDVKTGSKYGAVDCPETTGPPTESPC